MKAIYAFDIDGVLCHTREQHQREIEEELGVTLHLDERGHYDTWGFYHDSDEVMTFIREKAYEFWTRPTVVGNGTAIGQSVVDELVERGQFVGYVTRRHPSLYTDTYNWLRKKGFFITPLITRAIPSATLPHPQLHCMAGDTDSKAEHCRRMGADTLVEDSPKEALSAAQEGLEVVVRRANYNAAFEQECAIKRDEGDQHGVMTPYHHIRFISSLEELL